MDENPWVKVLVVLGLLSAVVGVIMLLIPSDPIDLARLLLGLVLATFGGTLLACWLLLAGFGWYSRQPVRRAG